MIVVLLVLLLTVAMVLVPGILAAGVIFVGRSHLAIAVGAGLGLGTLVLAFEDTALVTMLGRTLERTEPSDVTG